MKKISSFATFFFVLLGLYSCGPGVPTKEIEDAKSALERAKMVDAPVYASQDFMDAETDYNQANQFVEQKKNQEAKDKALSSKTKADKSYETAREKRARDIYEKCENYLGIAKENYAEKIMPEKLEEGQKGFDELKAIYEKKDLDGTYSNGIVLMPKLKEMADTCKAAVDNAKSAVAQAQNRYDSALNKEIVKQYALDDLKKAEPLLEEAKKALSEGNLKEAEAKAKEAEAIINAAEQKAQDAYQKLAKDKTKDQRTIDLDKQKELENQKQKASDFIEQAKQKLELLKQKQKGSFLNTRVHHFVYINVTPIFIGAGEVDARPAGSDSEKPLKDEDVNINMVEDYIKKAEDSYDREEYLDSIDYAKEAIRMADILLAREEYQTYTVKLRPDNRDCLWKISGYVYDKQYWLWPVIWRANKYQIQDPDLIYPGQELKIPPSIMR